MRDVLAWLIAADGACIAVVCIFVLIVHRKLLTGLQSASITAFVLLLLLSIFATDWDLNHDIQFPLSFRLALTLPALGLSTYAMTGYIRAGLAATARPASEPAQTDEAKP